MAENANPKDPLRPPEKGFENSEAFDKWIDGLHEAFRGYEKPDQLWQIYVEQSEQVRYYDSKISSFTSFLVAGGAGFFAFALTQLSLAPIIGALNVVAGVLGIATVIWYASAYRYHWEISRAFRRAYLKSLGDSKLRFLWRGVHMMPGQRYPRITKCIGYNAVWYASHGAVIASGIVLICFRDKLLRIKSLADQIFS